MGKFAWGRSSKVRLLGVHKILRIFADRLIDRVSIDITIPYRGGRRTAETQYDIFVNGNGATQRDGYTKKSYHQTGKALDIVAAGKTIEQMYDIDSLEHIMEVAEVVWCEMQEEGLTEGYTLELGGHWSWKDRPHYQIVKR